MFKTKILPLILVAVMAAGCADPRYGGQGGGLNKEAVGTLGGAAAGGIIGSNIGGGKGKIAATIIGTLVGAGIGNQIGASLDRADQAYYNQTSQRALETASTGQTLQWQNPDSGNYGTITPVKTYQEAGTYCREYNQKIVVGGKTQQGYGKACRQPDGSWQIVQ